MHPDKIELDGKTIRYNRDGSPLWEMPLESLRVLGEATDSNGPFLDDYYFYFASAPDRCFVSSFYADGREELLDSLSCHVGYRLELRLVGSMDFASNVMWPAHLAGKPMFTYTPIVPQTWVGRLFERVFGTFSFWQGYTEEVLQELKAERREI